VFLGMDNLLTLHDNLFELFLKEMSANGQLKMSIELAEMATRRTSASPASSLRMSILPCSGASSASKGTFVFCRSVNCRSNSALASSFCCKRNQYFRRYSGYAVELTFFSSCKTAMDTGASSLASASIFITANFSWVNCVFIFLPLLLLRNRQSES
jgi:hypothetical protein